MYLYNVLTSILTSKGATQLVFLACRNIDKGNSLKTDLEEKFFWDTSEGGNASSLTAIFICN